MEKNQYLTEEFSISIKEICEQNNISIDDIFFFINENEQNPELSELVIQKTKGWAGIEIQSKNVR